MKHLLSFFIIAASIASAENMKFTELRNGWANATGEIAADTPRQFEAFVKAHPRITGVRLDSVGGLIGPALELGRAIRERKLDTFVGGTYRDNMMAPGALIEYGDCASACVYVFAGGVNRLFDPLGGTMEVHQFYAAAPSANANASSNAQLTMALIGMYLDEMGVGRKVLDMATLAGSELMAMPGYMIENLGLGSLWSAQAQGANAAATRQAGSQEDKWFWVANSEDGKDSWYANMSLVTSEPGRIVAWFREMQPGGAYSEVRFEFDRVQLRVRGLNFYDYDNAGRTVNHSANPSAWKDLTPGIIAQALFDAVRGAK